MVAPGFSCCLYPASRVVVSTLFFSSTVQTAEEADGQGAMVRRWLSVKYDALVCLAVWQSRSESVRGGWLCVCYPAGQQVRAVRREDGGGASSDGGRRHRVVAASMLVLGR